MKAVVYHQYGPPDVLQLEHVDKPVVEDDEVLVRVLGTAVNAGDWFWLGGTPYLFRPMIGLSKPRNKILGLAIAGRVERVGGDVSQFQPGDEVYAETRNGGFAEYASVPEDMMALKPSNLTFEQAAAVPLVGVTALQGLRDIGRVQPGHKVLINGASGGVGTFAVQIAKAFGAEVTGVCSTRNVGLVRSIGADHVIDYTREDFTRSGQRHDLILDNVGNRSVSECRRVLNPKGIYIGSFGQPDHRWLGPLAQFAGMFLLSPFVSQKMVTFAQKPSKEDLDFLKDSIEAGKVTPVVDKTYPLSETAAALRYYGQGHTRGKVVITL